VWSSVMVSKEESLSSVDHVKDMADPRTATFHLAEHRHCPAT
jgi:hypothetical protein